MVDARLLDRDQLPTDRVVIRFDLTDLQRKNRFWMVLERDHTEVCLKNPGFPEQVLVTTTSEWWPSGTWAGSRCRRRAPRA